MWSIARFKTPAPAIRPVIGKVITSTDVKVSYSADLKLPDKNAAVFASAAVDSTREGCWRVRSAASSPFCILGSVPSDAAAWSGAAVD